MTDSRGGIVAAAIALRRPARVGPRALAAGRQPRPRRRRRGGPDRDRRGLRRRCSTTRRAPAAGGAGRPDAGDHARRSSRSRSPPATRSTAWSQRARGSRAGVAIAALAVAAVVAVVAPDRRSTRSSSTTSSRRRRPATSSPSGDVGLLRGGGSGRYQFWETAVDAFAERPDRRRRRRRLHAVLVRAPRHRDPRDPRPLAALRDPGRARHRRPRPAARPSSAPPLSPASGGRARREPVAEVGAGAGAAGRRASPPPRSTGPGTCRRCSRSRSSPRRCSPGRRRWPARTRGRRRASRAARRAAGARFAGGVALLLVAWISICGSGLLLLSAHSLDVEPRGRRPTATSRRRSTPPTTRSTCSRGRPSRAPSSRSSTSRRATTTAARGGDRRGDRALARRLPAAPARGADGGRGRRPRRRARSALLTAASAQPAGPADRRSESTRRQLELAPQASSLVDLGRDRQPLVEPPVALAATGRTAGRPSRASRACGTRAGSGGGRSRRGRARPRRGRAPAGGGAGSCRRRRGSGPGRGRPRSPRPAELVHEVRPALRDHAGVEELRQRVLPGGEQPGAAPRSRPGRCSSRRGSPSARPWCGRRGGSVTPSAVVHLLPVGLALALAARAGDPAVDRPHRGDPVALGELERLAGEDAVGVGEDEGLVVELALGPGRDRDLVEGRRRRRSGRPGARRRRSLRAP